MTTENNKTNDEAQVRQLMENWVKAFRSYDIDGIMSLYAPDIVSFDIMPPLQHAGAEAYRKLWEHCFEASQGPIEIEIRDLNITVGDDVAFSHNLNRTTGTMKNGEKFDFWVRSTTCFRKINGKWLITHEHYSVPVDVESDKPLWDLKP